MSRPSPALRHSAQRAACWGGHAVGPAEPCIESATVLTDCCECHRTSASRLAARSGRWGIGLARSLRGGQIWQQIGRSTHYTAAIHAVMPPAKREAPAATRSPCLGRAVQLALVVCVLVMVLPRGGILTQMQSVMAPTTDGAGASSTVRCCPHSAPRQSARPARFSSVHTVCSLHTQLSNAHCRRMEVRSLAQSW